MNVDISALRKFEDTFGPAIAAIPAVIDAVSQTNDLERHINLKKVELQQVMDDIESAKKQAEEFVAKTQARGDEIIKSADDYAASVKAEADAQREKNKDAQKKADASLVELNGKLVLTQTKLAEAEKQYAEKFAQMEADHATKVAAMNAEVSALEAKRAKVEDAISALKAKLEA